MRIHGRRAVAGYWTAFARAVAPHPVYAMLLRLPVGHIPRSRGFAVADITIVEQNAADFGKLLVRVS
jgi:hypothetical protein